MPDMFDDANSGKDESAKADDLKLLKALAATYGLFQRYATANSILALALLLDPSDAEALHLKAILSLEMEQPDEALDTLALLEATDAELPTDIDLIRLRAIAMQGAQQAALKATNDRA
jgi:tetratricopeptide (TPR) repeat protein